MTVSLLYSLYTLYGSYTKYFKIPIKYLKPSKAMNDSNQDGNH